MRSLFFLICLSFNFLAAPSYAAPKIKMEYTEHGPVYYPLDGKDSHPGVVVFHGSEGGGRAYNQLDAQWLAMHGYAALAYCYYQCLNSFSDLSDPSVEFIDIPVDKPYEGFKWFKNSKYTKDNKTALLGTSKGAELTFLIAAIAAQEGIEKPDAIAAHAVTDAAEVGFSWNWMSSKCWSGTRSNPIWNPACGSPVPGDEKEEKETSGCYATPKVPLDNYTYHSWTWKGSHSLIRTHQQIPLELYIGPIFFTHGTDDGLWCLSKAAAMRDRLISKGRTPEVHIFPGQGHNFGSEAEFKRKSLLLDFFDRKLR